MINFGDFDKAEENFKVAVDVNPDSPYTYYILGELFRMRGNLGRAEDYYRQALTHQANYQPALNGLLSIGINP